MELFHDLKTISLDANTELRITGMNLRKTFLKDKMSDLRYVMETQSQKTVEDVQQFHRDIHGIQQQLTGLEENSHRLQQTTSESENDLSPINNRLQELSNANEKFSEEFQGTKVYLDEINTRVVDLEGNTQHMISNANEELNDEFQSMKVYLDETNTRVDDLEGNTQHMISNANEELNDEFQSMKVYLDKTNTRVDDLEGNTQHMISNVTEDVERKHQEVEKRLTTLELHKNEIDSQQLGKNTLKLDQHDQQILQVEENLHHLQETTSRSDNDLEKSSQELKNWTEKRYENVIVTFEKSGLHPPKANKREDIVVGLSLIKDAAKAFFQAAESYIDEEEISKNNEMGIYRDIDNIVLEMRNELEEVSARQSDYNDIMTSPNDYVVISGAPGCGKSTLCETLAYNWACDKIWVVDNPNFQFVFILKFRELQRFKDNQNVTAKGILSHYYPEHFNEKTTTMLKNNSLLIFDGFDECFVKYDLLKTESEFTSYTRALYDLLDPHNTKLPCARLVTSRPASCSILFRLLKSEQCQPRLFEVTGFNMENVKKYVMHYYHQNSYSSDAQQEKLNKFLEEVKHSLILRSLMTIPFYCNGVCCLMLESEIGIESIPLTYTGLFTTLLTLFLRNHGLRNSKLGLTDVLKEETTKPMILMLSKFAFSMEMKRKITFTKRDFPKEFRNQKDFEKLVERTGLILKLDHDDEPFYQFVHYSFHEFLVALHLFHIGSTESSRNPYILSMVGGLTGGLVGVSKSTYLFVKNYARMFRPKTSMAIEVLLSRHDNISQFLAIVFEYQNKLRLKKHTIVRMSSTRGNIPPQEHHVQHFVKSSSEKHIVIDSVLIKTDLSCLHTHGELLAAFTQSALSKVLFVNGSYYPEEDQGIVRLSNKNSHFDRLISLEDTRIIAKYLDIASFTNDLEFIEYFDYDSVKDDIFKLPVGNVNVTIHMKVSEFVKTEASSKTKFEHYCKLFKSVTISLYTDTERRDRYHSHGSGCFPAKFIGEVKRAIVKNRYQLNNLKFVASCTVGVVDGVVPSIRKI